MGTGPDNCTDPKRFRKAITRTPSEHVVGVSINTFQGKRVSISTNSSDLDNYSFDSLWKTVDFVYDPVSFNRYDPIADVCYELKVPKSLQAQGIQFIEVELNIGEGNVEIGQNEVQMLAAGGENNQENAYVKVSPPGYLHQNIDVRSRRSGWSYDQIIELDYQIDNVLKIGDENCHPDPSFNRDECVTKQLLDVKSIHFKNVIRIETFFSLQNSIKLFGCIPPALGDYGLPTCKNGSEYSMREVDQLINCPEACTKYTMRVQSEVLRGEGPAGPYPKLTIKFKKQITVTYDQYSYIWLNLVAEVGGYVGLFLGFSVFQLTDLTEVLLQKNWIESFKSLVNRFKTRAATGSPNPNNPTRETHYSTRPEDEFRGSGKTRPDPKPKKVKPIATLFKTSKD